MEDCVNSKVTKVADCARNFEDSVIGRSFESFESFESSCNSSKIVPSYIKGDDYVPTLSCDVMCMHAIMSPIGSNNTWTNWQIERGNYVLVPCFASCVRAFISLAGVI